MLAQMQVLYNVYMIPGYKPFYQDTYNNKKKGQELPFM